MKEDQPDEVALLLGYLNRDHQTLTKLHSLIHKKYYWLAFNFLEDEALAADAVNDAFLAILQIDNPLTSIANIEAWLYKRVRWNCIAVLRKRANHGNIDDVIEMADEAPGIEERKTKAEYYHIIAREIDKLPEKKKKILMHYYLDDMTTGEIAEKLGMNIKTVHNTRRELVLGLRNKIFLKSLTILMLGFLLPLK